MSEELAGMTALVTGSQQGIGRAIAQKLAERGADVVVNYLDDEAAARTIESAIQAAGQRALLVQGDVSTAKDVASMLEATESLGGIDVLINNAAIFPRVAFLDMTEEQWDAVLEVNLKGAFRCTQATARQMVAHGRGGSVVNISSSAAFRSSPRGVHYVASKAGIVGLTRACALELAGHQIRVNAIAPGLTDTAQPRGGYSEEEIRTTAAQIPLGGINQPADVAELAAFLASPRAARITGQTVHLNGGQYLY